MATFIIIIIAASLLGSLLWIRPSHKEHMQMQLRLIARKKHLSVQFTHIDLPDKWDKSKTNAKITAYHKFRAKKATSLASAVNLYPYEVWKHDEIVEGWYASLSLPLSQAAQNILRENQTVFTAIRIEYDCVSLFWSEEGTEATVDDISRLLIELEGIDF